VRALRALQNSGAGKAAAPRARTALRAAPPVTRTSRGCLPGRARCDRTSRAWSSGFATRDAMAARPRRNRLRPAQLPGPSSASARPRQLRGQAHPPSGRPPRRALPPRPRYSDRPHRHRGPLRPARNPEHVRHPVPARRLHPRHSPRLWAVPEDMAMPRHSAAEHSPAPAAITGAPWAVTASTTNVDSPGVDWLGAPLPASGLRPCAPVRCRHRR
jgi:hypothetical protein